MEITHLNEEVIIKGVYTLFYQEKDSGFIFSGESHNFWELIYMDKGYAYLLINDQGYKISQGELFLFNKNQNHIVWSDSKVAPFFLTISFDMEFDDESYFEYKRFETDHELREIIRKILAERLNAFEGVIQDGILHRKVNAPKGSEQLIKIYLAELLIKLYWAGDKLALKKSVSSTIQQKSENWILEKSIAFINAHICERIYLDSICKNIPVSPSYLNRIYKKAVRVTVMEYVNHLKLEKSKELIKQSGHNISQISEMLGFASVHYFSLQFKNKYGMSPREYSKSLKAGI